MSQMTADQQLPPGLALAWGVQPPARRGPKPAHSVETIVATAIALADESGFDAVSMPKIASRLGITANALYRYVASKEELLVLLADTAWGPIAPPEHGGGWRDAVIGWVRAFVERTRVHPWLLDLPVRSAPLTPNLLGWLDVLLEALDGSGLSFADKLGCATLLDSYARSTANLGRDLGSVTSSPDQAAAVAAFLQPMLSQRGYGPVADLMSGAAYTGEAFEFDDGDVEFGLQRVLDGIDVLIERRAVGSRVRQDGGPPERGVSQEGVHPEAGSQEGVLPAKPPT